MKGPIKYWYLTGNSLRNSNQKIQKNPVIVWRTKQKNPNTLKAKNEHEPCSQEEINWSKIEKNIQNKTVQILQD